MTEEKRSDKCIECGLCKANCPVFNSKLKETYSPRGKAMLMKKGISDLVFFACTLCKACKEECPASVDLELQDKREELIRSGNETEANKKMIENIRKHGNPFGRLKKGEIPKELYCC